MHFNFVRFITFVDRNNLQILIIFFLFVNFLSGELFAQTDSGNKVISVDVSNSNDDIALKQKYSAIERLGVDYEIKNEKNPSSVLLEKLALHKIEMYRQEDTSVEILDSNSGVIIILYSINDALKKETEARNFIDYIRTLYFHEY